MSTYLSNFSVDLMLMFDILVKGRGLVDIIFLGGWGGGCQFRAKKTRVSIISNLN